MATLNLLIVGLCLLIFLTGCEESNYPNTDGYKFVDIERIPNIDVQTNVQFLGQIQFICDRLCLDGNHDLCFIKNMNCRMYDKINKTEC